MIDEIINGMSGSIMSSVFNAFTEVVYAAIEEESLNRDDYHIGILPFSLSRLDGKPVEKKLLLNLQKRFSESSVN